MDKVKIDRIEELDVEPERLPADAKFKGYEEVVVQDFSIHTDNMLFRKKKYHSESEDKTYLAKLPSGYKGMARGGLDQSLPAPRRVGGVGSKETD